MKKITFLFILVFLIGVQFSNAQKPFTGNITLTLTYDGTWDAATLAQQPKEFTIVMGADKQKSEFLVGGASISTIANSKDSSMVTLINAMGMKFFVKQTKDFILETLEEKPLPKIKYLEETKTIAGFECKKAEYITINEYDEEDVTIVWFTDKIGNPAMNFGGQFHGLNGFPMEYSVETDEGKITTSVSSIKKKKIKDTQFMIPADYEEMSPEQLRSMFGG
jgi:GLPGLI family protein